MGKLGLTATEIGHRINASAEVVNHLLVEKGLAYGVPGSYGITEKGKSFGVERSAFKNNSFGTFEWNNWADSVIDELGATPEKIAELTANLKAAKAAKRLADRAEAEQYWAGIAAAKLESVVKEDGSEGGLTKGQKLAIGVGVTVVLVVGGVLIYKGVRRHQRKKAEREAGSED